MPAKRGTLLCRYHYDPLDRLANCTLSAQARTQRFYLKERLTSEIQGPVQRSIFQHDDQLLAQQERKDKASETTLLACDQQRSVLQTLDAALRHPLVYTAYGYTSPGNRLLSLQGFNGERPDPATGNYLLGNGYRAFNPVLMRFNSPDSVSPFGQGGLNPYAYCSGDPMNRSDPSGHTWGWIKSALRALGVMKKTKATLPPGTISKVGYHGTRKIDAQNLMQHGLKKDHVRHKHNNQLLGDGFYISQDLEVAQRYAKESARGKESTYVLSVYVKDIQKKTKEGYLAQPKKNIDRVLSLHPDTYDDVSFKVHGHFDSASGNYQLESNTARIRQSAFQER